VCVHAGVYTHVCACICVCVCAHECVSVWCKIEKESQLTVVHISALTLSHRVSNKYDHFMEIEGLLHFTGNGETVSLLHA